MATCIEYHEERTRQCNVWEDQGYNSCNNWNPWWSWLCIAWTWITNVVCVAYTWVTTSVCVLWDTAVTVVDAILVTIESVFLGWILNSLAWLIELIFLIPVIGPIIQWVWNIVLTIISAILSVLDIIAYFLGIRPQKKLRVCTIALTDSKGNRIASDGDIITGLNAAIEIYFREMNILIIKSAPFQYSTGFRNPPLADSSWFSNVSVDDDMLTRCCNLCMAGEDLFTKGTVTKWITMTNCFWGNWRRLLGIGAPVAIFIIRDMESRTITTTVGTFPVQSIGCALGPLTDFIVVASQALAIGMPNTFASSPDTTAHELGHKCDLWHLKDANNTSNLMFANENNLLDSNRVPLVQIDNKLWGWQHQLVRMSRHVSYL